MNNRPRKPITNKAKSIKSGPSPIPKKDPDAFPMRINKYLALKGISTRREADKLIEKRAVTINSRIAVLGDKVNENDNVSVRNNKNVKDYIYYAYNKPRGVHTEPTRKSDNDILHISNLKGVFPVDSLDQNTEGLIILTNDRRIIDRMMNPKHAHEKEFYGVSIDQLRANFKQKMEDGMVLGDGRFASCTIHIIDQKHFTARITENTNHLRQMCALVFAELETLKRTRILNVELGKLPSNCFRKIEDEELKVFLSKLGL